ncbi:hypothetical protein EMIHUDRAFT_442960 [Emiliania huxleyi CCMP1516]|uniref:Uncharacterized protein n=2 Tax=Emiliania huxleyi TaxID=2903 RepID=A0A0D3JRY6_EMIH1|nr:hypothetical protein EMIHUDRAFT_447212 [Emiliania huxleyi CCMP1516]XP_005780734.1 hypothetical protein EMIHUDRAFT_442960 [Emiliania huxleyi CCMP1516]EOD26271.1 hypothetical protein EMIHUDRAFT_447212 [Emiliania huxleyi CCMP1516]EOD28305.1 hypothetical protein EMIHUDRAFT_442960 [Emiliania huxleyi CCMP1516]|eukprot:XP_005778700.1 hypothetical protein EMIHUDRAFT_447212 [Emiliania huxleyi CCMP1516]
MGATAGGDAACACAAVASRRRGLPVAAKEDRGLCWPARRRRVGWRRAQPRPHRRRRRLELGLWTLWRAGPRRPADSAAAKEGRGLGWPARRRRVGWRRAQPRPHRRRRCLYLGRWRTRPLRPRRGHVGPDAAQEDRGVGEPAEHASLLAASLF